MRLALAIVVAVLAIGCKGAQPYQRGKLAKSKMQFNPRPEATTLEQHVYSYRESSIGGYDAGGGGCGCN